MPWYIAVPGALGAAVAAGFLLLAAWMRLHGPAVAQQYSEAFAREHAARAAERVLEEASR
jgi:hypothetical protein